MATKTAKSQKRTKAVKTSAGQELATAAAYTELQLGPPFSGFYKEMSYPSPGYWNAVKVYPLSGQVTVQLGAVQQLLEGIGEQDGGFQKTFSVSSPGVYIFSLVAAVGPLTILPKSRDTVAAGATVYLAVNQENDRYSGAHTEWPITTDWRHPIRNAYYPVINLVVPAVLAANVPYRIHAGVGLNLEWTANLFNAPPYAEIVATLQNLTQSGPAPKGIMAAKQTAKGKADEGRYILEKYTDEEAAKM